MLDKRTVIEVPASKAAAVTKARGRSGHPHAMRFTLAGVAGLLVVLALVAGLLQEWLWMGQIGYVNVFWALLSIRWTLAGGAFLIAFLYLGLNLRAAVGSDFSLGRKAIPSRQSIPSSGAAELARALAGVSPRLLTGAVLVGSAGVAALFAIAYTARWDNYLRLRYGGSVGIADPLYGMDVGFYLFHLPFYELIQHSLTVLSILTFLVVLAGYLGREIMGQTGLMGGPVVKKLTLNGKATTHLSVLLMVVAANGAFGFLLDRYELVYSTQGVVYGAGYAADHVTRLALWFMFALSLVACALLGLNIHYRRFGALLLGVAAYVALYGATVSLVPYFVQAFVVQPSELALEKPYLSHYIEFTRKAYQLDGIQETSYPALAELTPAVLARNQDTIQNIRLWDARPLLQTYEQTQAIRLYYEFYNVGVDRYHLSDGYHQVMLSTRELAPELPLQAQTWVNKTLQFTHGYGAVMSFVSTTTGGGFPQYLLENVPAESQYDLQVTQPAIYYGESMPGYRIVDTGIKEFDYPKGNDNVYTSYAGGGGIPINSLWRKLLFAWTQGDINILLTSYITPDSRIQFWRRTQERVARVAPFLRLDSDPYPVLSAGRMYWIQDAYTTSDRYPYANPHATGFGGSLNYIRNSVKVLVDMFDGSVSFYVMDPKDPILAAYRRAFPGMFKDLNDLSPDLKAHLRYPEDLFAIQADEYKTFHMKDPQVFYNREDLWVSPNETYAGASTQMDPYYILMKLPGSDQLQYLLMTPFTPQNRDNMISWIAARCDFPAYGSMIFYQLPKEKLVYGPSQIEAMINQNTTISQQLTLWDQKGSRVIRGKLIVTPIENSFLYIVPVYLQAEGANFPQLKRVIAVAGDKVVMEPTLDAALAGLFGMPQQSISAVQAAAPPGGMQAALSVARGLLEEARKAMEQGDWEKYGTSMERLAHQLNASAAP